MTSDWLETALSVHCPKQVILSLAGRVQREEYPVRRLIDLTFHPVAQTAFRGSWLLENLTATAPRSVGQESGYFVARYPEQRRPSCRRHFARIFVLLPLETIAGLDVSHVIEATFDWLIDPATPVAVQANCLDVLLLLSGREPWLADELRAHIPFLADKGSVALKARGREVLKKLKAKAKS